jgi:hypothetical protein
MSTATFSFPRFRTLAAGAAVIGCLADVPSAEAQWRDREFGRSLTRAVPGHILSVEVRVDGDWVPFYRLPGSWDRHYFEAQRGENYELRIRNRTGRRVGVLIAVDGLNVVNGERSSLSRHEPMYVLDPRETTTIRGWRTSLEHVRRFVFVDEERSYANRTGQANGDMGWIRVLGFEEERPVAYRPPPWMRGGESEPRADAGQRDKGRGGEPPVAGKPGSDSQDSPPEALDKSSRSIESFPGTGWGDRRRDPVRETWFEPAFAATDHLVLRYEYERGLAALGIFPERFRLRDRERGEFGFARRPD